MKATVVLVFIALVVYSFVLAINFFDWFNPFGLFQIFLIILIPETSNFCILFPLVNIVAVHLILFQKIDVAAKNFRILRIICFILLYINITLTAYWVFSVHAQINKGHEIINEIYKYYDVNKKYPDSIDSIKKVVKADYIKKGHSVYKYECYKENSTFVLFVYPKELVWEHFLYTNSQKKFVMDD